jgi:hypothetical protein
MGYQSQSADPVNPVAAFVVVRRRGGRRLGVDEQSHPVGPMHARPGQRQGVHRSVGRRRESRQQIAIVVVLVLILCGGAAEAGRGRRGSIGSLIIFVVIIKERTHIDVYRRTV